MIVRIEIDGIAVDHFHCEVDFVMEDGRPPYYDLTASGLSPDAEEKIRFWDGHDPSYIGQGGIPLDLYFWRLSQE